MFEIVMEVAVVSSRGDNSSACIWNPFTSSLLASYVGGGYCSSHGLAASSGYVITSEVNKPMLHAWPLNKQHKISRRLIAPGKITCVAISPDANYIALSVDCKLHVYQRASGVLCGTGGNHFQPINVIKFNPEGTFIGCGGEDGLLTVWHLGDIVQFDLTSKKPFLSLNSHSLPITDLLFTGGDLRSRVITVSLDRSCKIHDVWTKDKLFGGHFENQLTALALCPRESVFYIGDADGHIREIGLLAPPKKVTTHYSNSSDELMTAKFHESRINCLSVSLDCSLLLSGSNDLTVKLIHIKSRQCLKTISQKGPITNCFFYVIPTDCFTNSFKPSIELHDFISKESLENNFSFEISNSCDIKSGFETSLSDHSISYDSTLNMTNTVEVENLKRINNDLYVFAVNKLMGGIHSHQFQPAISSDNDSKDKTDKFVSNSVQKKKSRKKRKLK